MNTQIPCFLCRRNLVAQNGTICLPAQATDRGETQFRQERRIQKDILRKPETWINRYNSMKI